MWGEAAGGEGEGGGAGVHVGGRGSRRASRVFHETSLFGKDVAEAVAAAVSDDAAEARLENRAPSRRATPPQGYGAGASSRQRSELDRMVDTALQTLETREASHEAGAMLAAAVAAGAAAGAAVRGGGGAGSGAVYGAVEVGEAEASEGVAGARPDARSVGQAACRAWRRRLRS